jgi:hypothetical protein
MTDLSDDVAVLSLRVGEALGTFARLVVVLAVWPEPHAATVRRSRR